MADDNQGTEVAPLFVNNQNLVLHLRRNFVSPTQLEVEQVPEKIFEMKIRYSWLCQGCLGSGPNSRKWLKKIKTLGEEGYGFVYVI